MGKINVAIIGVGNCASSLAEGIRRTGDIGVSGGSAGIRPRSGVTSKRTIAGLPGTLPTWKCDAHWISRPYSACNKNLRTSYGYGC